MFKKTQRKKSTEDYITVSTEDNEKFVAKTISSSSTDETICTKVPSKKSREAQLLESELGIYWILQEENNPTLKANNPDTLAHFVKQVFHLATKNAKSITMGAMLLLSGSQDSYSQGFVHNTSQIYFTHDNVNLLVNSDPLLPEPDLYTL